MGFNSFWPVYKNLEEETLQLTKYINFSDDQLKVYSMHIADLIIRIVVEIEALSKELYKNNGGPNMYDDSGKLRDLFFDTDCIKYLNNTWGICNREIIVSCANFNFTKAENKILQPLKKADKRGSSSAIWNKAYQAVKHDRRNALEKGNIENLIHALGALYILNVFYRDDVYEYGTVNEPNNFFDNRLGSNIFAATFADASKASISSDDSDNAINKDERDKLSTALCIIKYTYAAWENMHNAFNTINDKVISGLINDSEFIKKLNEKIKNSPENIKTVVPSLINEMKFDWIKKNPPIDFGRIMISSKKEVVLNKGQVIYK